MTRFVNVDNGGTLTDVCVVDGDQLHYTKSLTTPYDLSRCLFDGLTAASKLVGGGESLSELLQGTDYIRYSTTQGTNALVQRRGPKLGLLVTDPELPSKLATNAEQKGLLEALVGDRWAAVQADLDGDDEELNAQLVATINDLSARGASRLVVSIGGEHGEAQERRIRALLLRLYPRHLLGAIPQLFSWELFGGDRDDVRRTWSSLLNAFLHPDMERFLFNAEQRLREHRTRRPLLIFRNDGGSSRVSKCSAIKTYGSGPRAGAEGTRALAAHYGYPHMLMVDIGGTTTDVAEVIDGLVKVNRRGQMAGVPTSMAMAEVISHGVGGSSVIRVVDGSIQVGPDSVGAAPGPACFGLGGTDATITDVQLLTGVLDPSTYLEGRMRLDAGRSAQAVRTAVAEPLGISLDEALVRMEDAFYARVAETLRASADLQADTVIAAFGGAGPMSICGAARQVGIRIVVIPRTAAVFSAFGIGFSDLSQEYRVPLRGINVATIAQAVEQMRDRAERDMFAEGVSLDECSASYRLAIERGGDETAVELADPQDALAHLAEGRPASLELSLVAPLPHVGFGATAAAAPTGAVSTTTRAVHNPDGTTADLPIYKLLTQPTGATAAGPAVVEGPFFTMRLPAGWQFETTAAGDLLLTDKGRD